ncbi:TRAP transporter small permease [Paenalcaligenes hominis]|uniref:TRAP transporter small permease n=1 Tax=Paenalcaligenes hominis TaxID=643674 RepID=UPI003525C18E
MSTSVPRATGPYHIMMWCCGAFSAITFGLMSVLVTLDVLLRNLNIDLIPASVEITEYMLMIATFIAAPWLLYQGGHIRIDVVVNVLPRSLQRLLGLLSNALGFFVCGVLAWQSWTVLQDSHHQGSVVFKELIFPEWWLSLPLLIGSALLTLEFLRRLFNDFSRNEVA